MDAEGNLGRLRNMFLAWAAAYAPYLSLKEGIVQLQVQGDIDNSYKCFKYIKYVFRLRI